MGRQSWAHQGRHVPQALFSSLLSNDERARLASRILATPRIEIKPGKPAFPSYDSPINSLADFVTSESWVLFDLIGGDVGWMLEDPSKWDQNEDFLTMRKKVHHFSGVNDPAERICGTAKLFKVNVYNFRLFWRNLS
jgi:hypothetical protein